MMDERVEVAAEGVFLRGDPEAGVMWRYASGDAKRMCRHVVRDAIAALEAAGYMVARLEQVGWVWPPSPYDGDRSPCFSPRRACGDGSESPVYRIVKEGE